MDELQRHSAVRELYDRLRAIARSRMGGQHAAHTLDPTGLANEAVLRLLKCDPASIKSEEHLLALAAEAMRQILVDHARTKTAKKRGGAAERLEFPDIPDAMVGAEPEEIIAAHEALQTLETQDEQTATLIKLRLFAGLDADEIGALMGVSGRTIERRWRFAMASLKQLVLGKAPEELSLGEPAHKPD